MRVEIWIIEDTPTVARGLSARLARKFPEAAVRSVVGRDGSDTYHQFTRAKIGPEAILIVDGLNGYHRQVLADHDGPAVVFTGEARKISAPEGVPVYTKAGEEEPLFKRITELVKDRQEGIDMERSAIQDLVRYMRTVPPAVSGTDGWHIDVLRGLL